MQKKRVVIVHGRKSNPEDCWFPWLRRELEARGFEVVVPALPQADHPMREVWVPAILEAVGKIDEHTLFVGHSIGCQAILRIIEELPEGQTIAGAVFVGGFFDHVTGLRDGIPVKKYYISWFGESLNIDAVRARMKKSVAIFSDNDPFIPLDNKEGYREKVGSEIVVLHNMGHFNKTHDGITELPLVLEKVLEIAEERVA